MVPNVREASGNHSSPIVDSSNRRVRITSDGIISCTKSDRLFLYTGQHTYEITNSIHMFMSAGHQYANMNIPHGRGYLLVGENGCGKTSITSIVSSSLEANSDYLIIYADDIQATIDYLNNDVDDNEKVVIIMDDLSTYIDLYSVAGVCAFLKQLSDRGNTAWLLTCGTDLQQFCRNRYDIIANRYTITQPNADERKRCLSVIVKELDEESASIVDIDAMAYDTEGMYIPQLIELVLSTVVVSDSSYNDAINKLRKQNSDE